MAVACEFEKLLAKRVPHIHEKIFFSLDYKSFMKCVEVSKSWKDWLKSESFLRRGKSVFCKDIQNELLLSAKRGNVDMIRRVLSTFMVDINFTTVNNISPLLVAAYKGHEDVVQLLLDRGAKPNLADHMGHTPLHWAASHGHKGVVQLLLERGAEPRKATKMWFNSC